LRRGLVPSLLGHVAAVAWVLWVLAAPHLFDTPPEETITVDLVRPQDIPAASKPSDKQAPERPTKEPERAAPAQHAGADLKPNADHQTSRDDAMTSLPTFDFDEMMPLYNMRLPDARFDAPAVTTAKLAQGDVAAFRLHLKRCWKLPPGVAPTSSTRVVMRVFLSPNGALAADPMLIEAAAAADGPAVMHAADDALARCAPFNFLPADRYSEWKELDIAFSPREMAGGS
jgi:hypothetical protein